MKNIYKSTILISFDGQIKLTHYNVNNLLIYILKPKVSEDGKPRKSVDQLLKNIYIGAKYKA